MMLLEHDAKTLLAARGLPVPAGVIVRAGKALPAMHEGVVKAQVPVGGRGKAGGIRLARDPAALREAADAILGMIIKGHRVHSVRIEEPVAFVAEAYLSFTLDASRGAVTVMMSPHGGLEVEDESTRADLAAETVALDPEAMAAAVERLASRMPESLRPALREAGAKLVPAFFAHEALLLEINPLFVRADRSWAIGDTKLAIDENALPRQPDLVALIAENADLYPEAALKLAQGFDYVELDREGDIGLITTGAGLSMQLIDELTARGLRPFNFCDIRTGQFKGDPARLIQVMRWLAAGPNLRAVLINFFAGHTHLGEIARLLIEALDAVPELDVPIVARMIGNGLDEARATLAGAGGRIAIETNLEHAINLAVARMEPVHV
jgi:succinyl-CoA synthetase beta subunit